MYVVYISIFFHHTVSFPFTLFLFLLCVCVFLVFVIDHIVVYIISFIVIVFHFYPSSLSSPSTTLTSSSRLLFTQLAFGYFHISISFSKKENEQKILWNSIYMHIRDRCYILCVHQKREKKKPNPIPTTNQFQTNTYIDLS